MAEGAAACPPLSHTHIGLTTEIHQCLNACREGTPDLMGQHCTALSCHALHCWATWVPCPALPCPALHCPAQPSPAQPCPALPCPALHCTVLPCTALLGHLGAESKKIANAGTSHG